MSWNYLYLYAAIGLLLGAWELKWFSVSHFVEEVENDEEARRAAETLPEWANLIVMMLTWIMWLIACAAFWPMIEMLCIKDAIWSKSDDEDPKPEA